MSSYGPGSRLLHRLALGSEAMGELQLDLSLAAARSAKPPEPDGPHVFVAGLARAGTTILMRSLHATGRFASLTYQDMPFVLAPGHWARLRGRGRPVGLQERAHGDGLEVDAESPEALEEVFWRVSCGGDYLRPDRLVPHRPDDEAIARFRGYVDLVRTRYGKARYLSKNNNSILRLPAIRRAFPHAVILIPFRHPVAQARSLLEQHRRFVAMHAADAFSLRYMTWLVHHEFGADQRPFAFDGALPGGSPSEIGYWLDLWSSCYRHLLAAMGEDPGARFVCYEGLCRRSKNWTELIAALSLPESSRSGYRDRVGEPERVPGDRAAVELYEALAVR